MKLAITILLSALCSSPILAQSKIKFNKNDSLKLSFCNCDSVYAKWPAKAGPKADAPEFNGNGWSIQYNFQKRIGQCGYFEKFYFNYGLHFKYDADGNLVKVLKFYKGKQIGLCEIKK